MKPKPILDNAEEKQRLRDAGFVELDPHLFRPGTFKKPRKVRILMGNGGMGDMICQLSPLLWAMETQPHIAPEIYCHTYMIPLIKRILHKFPVQPQFKFDKDDDTPYIAPDCGKVNAIAMHLLDLAWLQFVVRNPPFPEYNFYPSLGEMEDVDISKFQLEKDYVVITPGATTKTRTVTAETHNGLVDYFKSKGLQIVFLGKEDIMDAHQARFLKDYRYDGLDLINDTDLLQAAKIMKGSKVVVGLDNGLLHLAAMTEAPIVFGYNITTIEHRRPRRKKGEIVDVTAPVDCFGCQSNFRFFDHTFKNCFYQKEEERSDSRATPLCLEKMTAQVFIDGLEKILK